MNLALSKLLTYLPMVTAFASSNGTMDKVVKWAGSFGGGVVALFLIIGLVKDGIGYAKGSGDASVLKIVGKVLFLILIIGLIYLAVNYNSLGTKGKNVADKVINNANTEVNQAL